MTGRKILFWTVICIIVFLTRFYKLDVYPPSLTIDEVSIGYNAFSILKTGKDEWGNFLPVSFRSVGDYKAPTLVYLTVPFVAMLGLTELATRLPVAILSTLSIYLFWMLVSRYIFSKKYPILPYLSTLVFSIAPWTIPFSRSGFEAIPALTFLLANILFAFEFRRSGRIKDFFFTFFFAYLSAITYHSTKIVVPLINIFFILFEYKYFLSCASTWYSKKKLSLLLVSVLFVSLTAFFVTNFVFGSGSSRASMTFLIKDYDYTHAMLPVFATNPLSDISSVIGLVSFWFKRYLEYFSANFYLSSGLGLATPGHPGQGVIYASEYPFLILGFFVLLSLRKYFQSSVSNGLVKKILIAWFFVSFIPASITNNSQHSLRTLSVVPVMTILISIGIVFVLQLIKRKPLRYILITIITIGYLLGAIRFVDYFTLHYPVELSEARSYGWKQMAIYARDHHSEYDRVYVDPQFGTDGPYTFGTPYLYFLFYSQYDPILYQNDPRRKEGTNFENYYFATDEEWPDFNLTKNNLYIASTWTFPQWLRESKRSKYFVPFLNRSSGFYAISN